MTPSAWLSPKETRKYVSLARGVERDHTDIDDDSVFAAAQRDRRAPSRSVVELRLPDSVMERGSQAFASHLQQVEEAAPEGCLRIGPVSPRKLRMSQIVCDHDARGRVRAGSDPVGLPDHVEGRFTPPSMLRSACVRVHRRQSRDWPKSSGSSLGPGLRA